MVSVKAEKRDDKEIENTVSLDGRSDVIFKESASAVIALLGALMQQSDTLFADVSMAVLGYINEQMDKLVDKEITNLAKSRWN